MRSEDNLELIANMLDLILHSLVFDQVDALASASLQLEPFSQNSVHVCQLQVLLHH